MCELSKRLSLARAKGIPLIRVSTSDQPAAEQTIIQLGDRENVPVVGWNRATGWSGLNQSGQDCCATMLDGASPLSALDPVEAIPMLQKAQSAGDDRGGTIAVFLAGDRVLADPISAVAILRLRTYLEASGITLITLGSTGISPCSEIGADAWPIDDPSPDADRRAALITTLCADTGAELSPDDMRVAVQYTRGLSAFGTRQALAPSLKRSGIDRDLLRSTWRAAIDSVPGLRVVSEGEGLSGVAGLSELRAHATSLFTGRTRPDAIVWVDEVEKALAGSTGGDLSGASSAILGTILTELEDSGAEGAILVGPPGTGKSLMACAVGAAGSVPTIQLDLGRLKGGLVGQTEAQAAQAMRVLRALAGRAYWIATSNGLASIPTELRRRFTDGIWMCDLPNRDERSAIWELHASQFELAGDVGLPPTDDRSYSGADIRNVCRSAWRTMRSVRDVAASYVPSTLSAREQIETLRRNASGTYRSASYPGPYRMPEQEAAPSVATGARRVQLDDSKASKARA